MLHISHVLCSSISVFIFVASTAQSLPPNPTPGQLAGYQVQQQKKWVTDQFPKNSVQYKMSYPNNTSSIDYFISKKDKPPVFTFPAQNTAVGNTMPNPYQQPSNTLAQSSKYTVLQNQELQKDSPSPKTSVLLKDYGKRNKNYFPKQ